MPKKDFSFQKPFGMCLFQAPYIDSDLFVGRASELEEMEKSLMPSRGLSEQQRLVIGGVGGIGKTQLAIAYAKSHHDVYESTFWVDASSEAALKTSFKSIAILIFDKPAIEDEQMVTCVRQWLSDTKNHKWLLIFDNYDEPGQFKIENYFPPASNGTIIITTRRPTLIAGRSLRIQSLQSIEESLAMLQTRSRREHVASGMVPTIVIKMAIAH